MFDLYVFFPLSSSLGSATNCTPSNLRAISWMGFHIFLGLGSQTVSCAHTERGTVSVGSHKLPRGLPSSLTTWIISSEESSGAKLWPRDNWAVTVFLFSQNISWKTTLKKYVPGLRSFFPGQMCVWAGQICHTTHVLYSRQCHFHTPALTQHSSYNEWIHSLNHSTLQMKNKRTMILIRTNIW